MEVASALVMSKLVATRVVESCLQLPASWCLVSSMKHWYQVAVGEVLLWYRMLLKKEQHKSSTFRENFCNLCHRSSGAYLIDWIRHWLDLYVRHLNVPIGGGIALDAVLVISSLLVCSDNSFRGIYPQFLTICLAFKTGPRSYNLSTRVFISPLLNYYVINRLQWIILELKDGQRKSEEPN